MPVYYYTFLRNQTLLLASSRVNDPIPTGENMTKKNTYDPSLLQFATTDRQREIIQAVIEAGTIRQAAKELGVGVGTVSGVCTRVRRKAAAEGFKDETTRKSEGHVGEEFDLEESGDTANLKIVSHKPLTEEEVLAKAGLSDAKWHQEPPQVDSHDEAA